ncbi:MAG: phosphatase PAP2 family protein [Brevefilum sp.]
MTDIHAVEIAVNQFFQSLGAWMEAPMLAITSLGYEQFFVLLLPTIYWSFDQMVGLRVGLVLLLSNVVNNFLKFLFHSPRPYWISDKVQAYSHETSFGLPSGHAQIAASVWGWLAVEVKKRWFTILSVILIFLIGISRIYLGVHFLTDVLLGWLLGGLLVWAFSAWQKPIGEWIDEKSLWSKIGLITASAVLILALIFGVRFANDAWLMDTTWAERAGEVDPYKLEGIVTVSGTWYGMLCGFVILTEKRGQFLAGEGGWRRLVRFFVGLAGVAVLYLGLGVIFPDGVSFISLVLRFLRYSLIGFWVSWWGPLVFEWLGLLKFEHGNSVENPK